MANVQLIITSLNTIANARFVGPPVGAQPTLRHKAFDRFQNSARQVATILTQNPNPGPDGRTNITAQFAKMQEGVRTYCSQAAGTEDVLRAFNKASSEWQLLAAGH